jgi:hypothetical protein
MNKQKQIEACARLEFGNEPPVKKKFIHYDVYEGCNKYRYVPNTPTYDTHDSVQRLIDGLGLPELAEVFKSLVQSMTGDFRDEYWLYDFECVLKATPAQKREALLKAKGLWEESE